MSAIDSDDTLPPLWGRSYWWTRSGALLGLLSLITGVVMAYLLALHCGSCGLANQLTEPTLAIEVAGSWEDVLAIVGPCEGSRCLQSNGVNGCYAGGNCKVVCPDKVAALRFEQYLDFGFICVYWLFFLYLGVVNWRFCYWARHPLITQTIGKGAAVATVLTSSLGAVSDWRENNHILQALQELHVMAGPVPVMRDFAYIKWRLLFFAIGTASPVFIFWMGRNNVADARRSAFSQALAWLTAVLALSTAWTGFAACLYGDDHRLQIATQRLDLVILVTTLTLATAQYWRGGTMAALDRMAKLPVLAFFATLFSSEVDARQSSDSDPSLLP